MLWLLENRRNLKAVAAMSAELSNGPYSVNLGRGKVPRLQENKVDA